MGPLCGLRLGQNASLTLTLNNNIPMGGENYISLSNFRYYMTNLQKKVKQTSHPTLKSGI